MSNSNSKGCPSPQSNPVNDLFYEFPWDKVEDRTTSLDCQNPKNLYSIRNDPIEAVGYIRKLLEQYMNDPECIYRGSVRQFITEHLNENEDDPRAIRVNGVGFSDTSVSGEKPCIYIKYAGSKFQQDFAFDNSVSYNKQNAEETFYARHIMAFSVFAVSEQYTESLALIEEVRRFLHYFQAPIKRGLCWKKLEVIEMQAPAKDETFDCFTSTLSCIATFDELWAIQEAAPLLKKIDFNV